MILTQVSPPGTEPVSVAEAKDHLRITTNDDDGRLTGYIKAARLWVEHYTGRALITQSWNMWLDRFPYSTSKVQLPKAPAQAISSVTYVDASGSEQTLSSAVYTADTDSDPAQFYLAHNQSWPTTRTQPKAVKIIITAGYGDQASDVPREIVEAILLQIQILYEQPVDKVKQALEDARDSLLSMYRVTHL